MSRPIEKTGMQIDRQPDGTLVIRANPALLQTILVALGAPVEESIEQLAAGGERITAIQLARQRLGLSLSEAKQHVDRLRG